MVTNIIGLTGPNCAGKSLLSDYLVKKKRFTFYSLSDMIREEAKKRGLDEKDREVLIPLANEMRKDEGYATLAKRLLKHISDDKCENSYVVDSIRHPEEVLTLMTKAKFNLISIDAHLIDRFKRSNDRNRDNKLLTLEEFVEQDKREYNSVGEGQQVAFCMGMAQYRILNTSTQEQAYEKLELVPRRLEKQNWKQYMMMVAHAAKKRSTCDRLHAGSVIWNKNTKQIMATGYNGSPPSREHCDDMGHEMEEGHCIATIHGEENALLHVADWNSLKDCTISTTGYPCYAKCYKKIIASGIKEIHYDEAYRKDPRVDSDAKRYGIKIEQVSLPKHSVF